MPRNGSQRRTPTPYRTLHRTRKETIIQSRDTYLSERMEQSASQTKRITRLEPLRTAVLLSSLLQLQLSPRILVRSFESISVLVSVKEAGAYFLMIFAFHFSLFECHFDSVQDLLFRVYHKCRWVLFGLF